jgi:hypothetical protein
MDEKSSYNRSFSEDPRHEYSRRNHRYGLHTVLVAILLGTGYLLCSFAPEPYNHPKANHALKKLQKFQDPQSVTDPDTIWDKVCSLTVELAWPKLRRK